MNFKRAILEQQSSYQTQRTFEDLTMKINQLELDKEKLLAPSGRNSKQREQNIMNRLFSKYFDSNDPNNDKHSSNFQSKLRPIITSNREMLLMQYNPIIECGIFSPNNPKSSIGEKTDNPTDASLHLDDSPLLDDSVLFNDGFKTPSYLSASKVDRKDDVIEWVRNNEYEKLRRSLE